METAKLTLSIPKDILIKAKLFSKRTGKPISRLVAHYFSSLPSAKSPYPITSRVKQVTGLVKKIPQRIKDPLLEAMLERYR